jgi:hypothetical protein
LSVDFQQAAGLPEIPMGLVECLGILTAGVFRPREGSRANPSQELLDLPENLRVSAAVVAVEVVRE